MFWNRSMSVADAIAVERKNVNYCLLQAELTDEEF